MLELYNGFKLVIEAPRTDRIDIITTGGTFVVKTPQPLTQQELEAYIRTLISTPVTTVLEVDIKSMSGNVRHLSLVGSSIVAGRLRYNNGSKARELSIYGSSGVELTGANKMSILETIMSNSALYSKCEAYLEQFRFPTDLKTYLNNNVHNMRLN